ncbi:MAG: FeoA family protein [Candidatus Krumholzibacteria bacterium]|jgi:Fe2+ transport system protein FeoA|nr:FeoA family protein [Candidatus Krumholzibacteria bacterium]MDY0110726.1 FeoA family protein [Candidatus Krumholzibacteria bacterium]
MPLALIREGTKAILRSIQGGRGLRGRLAAMGLVPGAEITVLRNGGGGPFVVAVKDNRICIGRGMAMKIEVE